MIGKFAMMDMERKKTTLEKVLQIFHRVIIAFGLIRKAKFVNLQ